MLSVYHSGGTVANQHMIGGSNVYSSTYSGLNNQSQQQSQNGKKKGGDTISRMNKEELELRKKGGTPSKEFLVEKQRLWRQEKGKRKQTTAGDNKGMSE